MVDERRCSGREFHVSSAATRKLRLPSLVLVAVLNEASTIQQVILTHIIIIVLRLLLVHTCMLFYAYLCRLIRCGRQSYSLTRSMGLPLFAQVARTKFTVLLCLHYWRWWMVLIIVEKLLLSVQRTALMPLIRRSADLDDLTENSFFLFRHTLYVDFSNFYSVYF